VHASNGRSAFGAQLFAWAGSALFLASLAYFLFSYAVTFGVPSTGEAIARPVTWNVVLFTIFAMHHSVFARERVREWITDFFSPRLERSVYVWVASLLFIAVCAWWQPVPGMAWRMDGLVSWVLTLLQLAGVWLTLRSAAILDVLDLSGVRQAQQRAPRAVDFTPRGPYAWVRHPIYTGWFLMVFAAPAMTMTRLVFAVVSGAYLLAAIPFEERSLLASAPDGYQRYRAEVRWKLVPGLY
jgi:protein-S-isoprenylcysteine O-methyltransferase Ste14